MSSVLIFPSSHSAAYGYYQNAVMNGEEAVAASSLQYDETAPLYKTWFPLPSIYAGNFVEEFRKAVRKYGVDRVYSPSAQVFQHLQRLVEQDEIPVKMTHAAPGKALAEYYSDLLEQARQAQPFINAVAGDRSTLSEVRIAAVMRQIGVVYGESHQSKLLAMMGIFENAPAGDVIEIGTLLGKTAVILGMLANWYRTGPVLVVDPWQAEFSLQSDSPQPVRDTTHQWNWDTTFLGFRINTVGQFFAAFNYLRASSMQGYEIYLRRHQAVTEEFGETTYSGKIAVLHIDANHDYAEVSRDFALWRNHIVPGGWLILDDYVWHHGNGPQRVGDALLDQERHHVARAFTAGNALFVKFRNEPSGR